jgi:hypothetical protein
VGQLDGIRPHMQERMRLYGGEAVRALNHPAPPAVIAPEQLGMPPNQPLPLPPDFLRWPIRDLQQRMSRAAQPAAANGQQPLDIPAAGAMLPQGPDRQLDQDQQGAVPGNVRQAQRGRDLLPVRAPRPPYAERMKAERKAAVARRQEIRVAEREVNEMVRQLRQSEEQEEKRAQKQAQKQVEEARRQRSHAQKLAEEARRQRSQRQNQQERVQQRQERHERQHQRHAARQKAVKVEPGISDGQGNTAKPGSSTVHKPPKSEQYFAPAAPQLRRPLPVVPPVLQRPEGGQQHPYHFQNHQGAAPRSLPQPRANSYHMPPGGHYGDGAVAQHKKRGAAGAGSLRGPPGP